VSVIPKLFADFTKQGESEIWNIQISDQVTAPVIARPSSAATAICERFDYSQAKCNL
jgi:hypothetical protein